jgi:hypothetical protein
MFALVPDWLNHHQLVLTISFFLISLVVSIYGQDIKRYLHEWPKTKEKVRQAKQRAAIQRVALLNQLHNNSYALLLYFAIQFIRLIFEWLALAIVFSLLIGFHVVTQRAVASFLGLLAGAFFGMCDKVRKLLAQLTNYDESVKELQQRQ